MPAQLPLLWHRRKHGLEPHESQCAGFLCLPAPKQVHVSVLQWPVPSAGHLPLDDVDPRSLDTSPDAEVIEPPTPLVLLHWALLYVANTLPC